VPPGKEGKIELAVEHTDGYAGEVSKSASVSTNDPRQPNFSLILRARFKFEAPPTAPVVAPLNPNPVFMVEPGERWITSSLTGSSSSNTLYLFNAGNALIHAKSVNPGGGSFTATLQPIQDGKRYQLNVTSNPALKPGHYLQTLKVLTDSAAQPEVNIELDLTVFPKVFASPNEIRMPPLPLTPDVAAVTWPTIYIRKVREQGLKIKSYSTTLPFLKLELSTETEGQVYKIQISLDTTKIKPGQYSGKIRVETNDADVPVLEVPLQIQFK
jgi:hypothetical protein